MLLEIFENTLLSAHGRLEDDFQLMVRAAALGKVVRCPVGGRRVIMVFEKMTFCVTGAGQGH